MRKHITNFTVLTLCSTLLAAADFNGKFTQYPIAAPPGVALEVHADVWNASGAPRSIACKAYGFESKITARRADGKPRICPQLALENLVRIDSPNGNILPANWRQHLVKNVKCDNDEPGDLIVQLVIKADSQCTGRGAQGADMKGWSGEWKSEEIHVKILELSVIDKQVLEKYKGSPMSHEEDIIRDYPNSIYAGYALVRRGAAFGGNSILNDDNQLTKAANLSSEQRVREVESAGSVAIGKMDKSQEEKNHLLRDSNFKAERIRLGKNLLESWSDTRSQFIKGHPDFPQISALRYYQALEFYILGRDGEAIEQVKLLAATQGDYSEEARAVCKAIGAETEKKSAWSWWPW